MDEHELTSFAPAGEGKLVSPDIEIHTGKQILNFYALFFCQADNPKPSGPLCIMHFLNCILLNTTKCNHHDLKTTILS